MVEQARAKDPFHDPHAPRRVGDPSPSAFATGAPKPETQQAEGRAGESSGEGAGECRCAPLTDEINAFLKTVPGSAGCRLVALSRVLAKECCDASDGPGSALALGGKVIRVFQSEVEEIVVSDDFLKRSGSSILDLGEVNPVLVALLMGAIQSAPRA